MEQQSQDQVKMAEDFKDTVVRMQNYDPAGHQELALQGEAIERVGKSHGLWQSLTLHKKILIYLLASYSAAACYGFDTIANGATQAMPAFELYYGHMDPIRHVLYLDSIWTSLWSSMTGLGQVLGAFISSPLSQRIGRRYSGVAFGCVTVIGVAIQFTASSKGMLLAGKMINGVAVGGLLSIGTTYASEISPPRLRGVMLGGLAFFAVATQTVGLGVVRAFVPHLEPSSFRTVFALQWVVGGLPIIAFFLVPESPSHLIIKGNIEASRQSLICLYGKDNQIDARLAHLQDGIQRELNLRQSSSYLDCFRGADLKRTLTVCLLTFGTGLVGSALLSQNIYFLIIAGLPAVHCFDINIGGFALALICMPLSWYYGDSFGRRSLYLVGIVVNTIVMGVIGGLGYAPITNLGATWAVAVLMNLLITWQSFTTSLIAFSLPPEISSYKLRQHTQSISVMVQAFSSWLFPFVTPYMYNLGKHSANLGAKTGFIYMGTSIVLFILAFLYIPEIRGLSTEEVDYLYEKRVNPRKFSSVARPQSPDKMELRSKNSSLAD